MVDPHGGQTALFKAGFDANHRDGGLKHHGLPAHLAQLGTGAHMVARFAQRQALQVGHLIRTDHHGSR